MRIELTVADGVAAHPVGDDFSIGDCAHRLDLLGRRHMHAAMPPAIERNGIDAVMRELELLDGSHHRIGLALVVRLQTGGGQERRADDHGSMRGRMALPSSVPGKCGYSYAFAQLSRFFFLAET